MDTRKLAREIERGEIDGRRGCIESARMLAPHLGAEAIEFAGGIVPFVGIGSPFSEAVGVGSFEEATPADVDRLVQFFIERKTPPRLITSPFSTMSLTDGLARRGFRPCEYQNVLACEIDQVESARDERIVESHDPHAWGRTSAAGFLEREPAGDEALIGVIIAGIQTVVALEARVDGAPVAAAALDASGEVGALFAASTLPHARRAGWQLRLIRDRLARARQAGSRYAQASAAPGSPSERNFRRAGFEVLYTRIVWELSS